MARIGSSGFLGRVNNEEDIFKKKKNTVDNSVTPESTKSASKAKIATPSITQTASTASTKGKNISVEAYTANDIKSANNALNKALKKSGLINEEK